ncbi:PREDICTED: protein bunched, class 2/F/G isoform-like, partial [Rhagoletis zephyria]|uniref:protein bunched, class 2/F/G isoform-like n=1 Tax=Rhagoletis zephyria TaxID=28612 RepID=UPI0008113F56
MPYSYSSLSQAMHHSSSRKRAFSTPHITPAISTLLNMSNNDRGAFLLNNTDGGGGNNNNFAPDQLVYYMKTASPHELENSSVSGPWIQGRSDTNIYTNLALGHNRYKLLQNYDANDEDEDVDEDEAIDQFSPTIYPTSRAIPIPLSAGNSPQHLSSGQQTPQLPTSPTIHAAYSAGPMTSIYPYSPFYGSSPDSQTPVGGSVGGAAPTPIRMSCSYDQALGANFKRMPTMINQQQQ